ncbi:polysaccharide biosynthesis/export family protein [Microbulbifer thermotolerans]|uniref:polysaccharide biosynthesis/export family protein n=1 Tax=Microbulbifer thermotolerans TaxID=252514 RepID=UPI002248C5E8|nr:SLBB domain-containing protein [Microbulbifer thermotolerans]MCX2780147.1 SLBB domain-containing protein [Microbulbifer thermotolerans]MCX2805571.1 SLBB domain-containing protein [Microbulbifer thermotolerans]MCX2831901.1 SLBB domain-containing protein [Microbulbifer thermotolerans]
MNNRTMIAGKGTIFRGILGLCAALICAGALALETQVLDETSPETIGGQRVPVFGHTLFQGAFKDQPFSGFNPDYRITVGDQINLQLWGAYSFSATLPVDPQGNIFVPEVGPVHVAGVKNDELNDLVLRYVKRVFKNNVHAYANLEASQPVKVFVTGYVNNPGLYGGFSSDTILYYLDSAGGIDPASGSFIDIKVLRGDKLLQKINLYNFLVEGTMPALQLRNGDAIVVGPRNASVTIEGAVQREAQIEFTGPYTQLGEMLLVVKPDPLANFARITQVIDNQQQAAYLPLEEALTTPLHPGARVELVRESDIKSISVKVSGELNGPASYVLPYGATLGDLLKQINYRENADASAIQLYRKSVAEKQRAALERSLDALEMEVLTRQPNTDLERSAQSENAAMIQKFIAQARKAQPRGQVVLANNPNAADMLLEDGDELVVPLKASTVSVVGEVIFPTSLVFNERHTLEDYIEMAGGFANNANQDELVLLHLDGTISRIEHGDFDRRLKGVLRPGDEIMVMPKIQSSELQVTKDVTEILYRIAVGTAAVLSF